MQYGPSILRHTGRKGVGVMAGLKPISGTGFITIGGKKMSIYAAKITTTSTVTATDEAMYKAMNAVMETAFINFRTWGPSLALAPWITRNRERLAELLWISEQCFERSITALGTYHGMIRRA